MNQVDRAFERAAILDKPAQSHLSRGDCCTADVTQAGSTGLPNQQSSNQQLSRKAKVGTWEGFACQGWVFSCFPPALIAFASRVPWAMPASARPASSERPLPRVVSLLPSATEMLAYVAPETWQQMLVGRSHECDFPQSASLQGPASVPVLTAARTHVPLGADAQSDSAWGSGASAAIDAQVTAALQAGQSLYTLDEDLLAKLRPDVILTQNLCEVCSIDLPAVQRVVKKLEQQTGSRCEIVSCDATTVEGIFDDCLRVGEAVGVQAISRVVRLRERMFEAGEFVNPYAQGQIVALLEWTDPLFCAGHWTVQLLERAGAEHPWNPTRIRDTAGAAMGPQQGERVAGKSRRITSLELAEHDPEAIIIAPCGLNLSQTRHAAKELLAKPCFASLRAVKNKRVVLVDGNQWFNRPGPRVVDAYEWLVSWLQGVQVGEKTDGLVAQL